MTSPYSSFATFHKPSSIVSKIHSRRFREYCNQVLNRDIDECCTHLLQHLVRFQDNLYQTDVIGSQNIVRRRTVLGLREVTKHLKLCKLKAVIISPNLETTESKGGLDEALNSIISMCHEQRIPLVFALGRRALGRACAKPVPVSVVGIFSYEGVETYFNKLCELTEKARHTYQVMVAALEQDSVHGIDTEPTGSPPNKVGTQTIVSGTQTVNDCCSSAEQLEGQKTG
jgi:ribosomal protein L7Ae-like RNA K-turn-binding protein